MKVYVEDISEEYGAHGIRVFSLVRGMESFTAEVRASGITLFETENYPEGQPEMTNDHPAYESLISAVIDNELGVSYNGK